MIVSTENDDDKGDRCKKTGGKKPFSDSGDHETWRFIKKSGGQILHK